MEYTILTLNDLEDLNFLAEDVLHEIRFNGYRYTEDGEYIQFSPEEGLTKMNEFIENAMGEITVWNFAITKKYRRYLLIKQFI